ncbi:MAG: protein of unknown function DUF1699 [Podoviridae sp. ctQNx1]|nr:MAG: protein of unknown function DUF1699 [Podoviridae sp. ctQNx1]UOF78131.1 hypothetical protein [Caudoviricetes sp.]
MKAAVFAALLLIASPALAEENIEYPPNYKELCKQPGGCVVIPKSLFKRMAEAIDNALKIIDHQSEENKKIRGRLNKSCA